MWGNKYWKVGRKEEESPKSYHLNTKTREEHFVLKQCIKCINFNSKRCFLFLTQLSTGRQFEHSITNSILSTVLKGTFPSLTLSPCLHLPTDAFALWDLLSTPHYLWSRMGKTTTTQGRQPYPIYPFTWRNVSEGQRQLRFFLFLWGFCEVGFSWVGLVRCGLWVVCFYLFGAFLVFGVFYIYTHFHWFVF